MGIRHATAAPGSDSGDGKISHNAWDEDHVGGGDIATDGAWAAKGDLIVGTAADTAAILTAGTNGLVLTADDGEATGLKWASAAGGGFVDPMTQTGDLITRAAGADQAPGKTVTVDSTRDGAASNLVDGNSGTGWQSNGYGNTAWAKVDLGVAMAITQIHVGQYHPVDYRASQIHYEGSLNDTDWTDLGSSFTVCGDIDVYKTVTGSYRYYRISETGMCNPGGAWYVYIFGLYMAAPVKLAIGTVPQILGITAGTPAWIQQTVRAAAGVPSGAPTGTELPIAADTTATTGGLYFWAGADWEAAAGGTPSLADVLAVGNDGAAAAIVNLAEVEGTTGKIRLSDSGVEGIAYSGADSDPGGIVTFSAGHDANGGLGALFRADGADGSGGDGKVEIITDGSNGAAADVLTADGAGRATWEPIPVGATVPTAWGKLW